MRKPLSERSGSCEKSSQDAEVCGSGARAPWFGCAVGSGLWWWLDEDRPGVFLARGNKGQFIHVDPGTGVVVARFGEDLGIDNWPDVLARTAEQVATPAP